MVANGSRGLVDVFDGNQYYQWLPMLDQCLPDWYWYVQNKTETVNSFSTRSQSNVLVEHVSERLKFVENLDSLTSINILDNWLALTNIDMSRPNSETFDFWDFIDW